MIKNLFKICGTRQWKADNLRRMLKINGLEENIEGWVKFSEKVLKEIKMSKNERREILKELLLTSMTVIEENI